MRDADLPAPPIYPRDHRTKGARCIQADTHLLRSGFILLYDGKVEFLKKSCLQVKIPRFQRGILFCVKGEMRMEGWLDRQKLLLGEEACRKLAAARVAVVGLGGVGGACVEGLCRAGVGALLLMDHDTVDLTNLNRQLLATRATLGISKAQAAKERVLSINPDCEAAALPLFYGEETSEQLFSFRPDYVVACIDNVTAKLHLAVRCRERGVPLLMALGTGNRLDPSAFRIGTIEETAQNGAGCGLARVMRRELKKRGIAGQKVLYSLEPAAKTVLEDGGRYAPGSLSVCPPAAGFLMASQVIREIGEF